MAKVKNINSAFNHSQSKEMTFKALLIYTRTAAIVTDGGMHLRRTQALINLFG